MRRRFFLGIAFVLASGCDDDSGIVGPDDLAELARAEAKWNARPFADYSYEIRTSCFCPPEIVRWTRVSVRGGEVVDVEAVDPDPNFPITNPMWWHPVDSVFVTLRRHMTQHSEYLASIDVAYDDVLGYPTTIELRAKPTIADGDATYNLRNVVPLP